MNPSELTRLENMHGSITHADQVRVSVPEKRDWPDLLASRDRIIARQEREIERLRAMRKAVDTFLRMYDSSPYERDCFLDLWVEDLREVLESGEEKRNMGSG